MSSRHASRHRRIGYRPAVDGLEGRVVLNGSMMSSGSTSTYSPYGPTSPSSTPTVSYAGISRQVSQTRILAQEIREKLAGIFVEETRRFGPLGGAALEAVRSLTTNASTAVKALQLDQSNLNSYYTSTLASLERAKQGQSASQVAELDAAEQDLAEGYIQENQNIATALYDAQIAVELGTSITNRASSTKK